MNGPGASKVTYTEAELVACLDAIRDEHPDAEVLKSKSPWVDLVLDQPAGRWFYVIAQDPSTVEVGSIYVTWVVELRSDGCRTMLLRARMYCFR